MVYPLFGNNFISTIQMVIYLTMQYARQTKKVDNQSDWWIIDNTTCRLHQR